MSRFPILAAGTAALALAACQHKADTTVSNTDVNMVSTDNMTVPADETMTNGAMPAASTADFVTNAAMGDMYEIAASKLAAANAESAGVKDFATQMIAAHTATTAGLKAAIAKGGVTATPPAALDAEHQAMIDALKAAKGADFDALYKSQQAAAHDKALNLMQGYSAGGENAALKAFAADTAPKVQSHIEMLGKL